MVLVYGFIEEPRLLVHGGGGGQPTRVRPSALTGQLVKSLPGLLVAAMVGLHENNKVKLEQADHMFKVCGVLLSGKYSSNKVIYCIFLCVCVCF